MIESPLIEELIAQAEQRARRKHILRALENRFGTVPADLAAAVRVTSDEQRLNELFDLAILCSDLDAFRVRLRL